jgi:hypothetical protein
MLEQYLAINPPHLVLLTEVHMLPAACTTVQGYDVLWLPRSKGATFNIRGGVAVLVRHGTHDISEAQVLESCSRADVLWIRLTLPSAAQPLAVAVTYLPPDSPQFICTSCTHPSCPRSHVASALEYLQHTAAVYGRDHHILIAGDFNAQATTTPPTRRWRDVQTILNRTPLNLLNPTDSTGHLLPTRLDPVTNGTSVLDLIFSSPTFATQPQVEIDQAGALSDHFPLRFSLHLPALLVPVDVHPDPHYGLRPTVPHHYRMAPRLSTLIPPLQRQQLVSLVENELQHSIPTDSSDPAQLVSHIECTVMRTLKYSGLLTTAHRPTPAQKTASLLQRHISRLQHRIHTHSDQTSEWTTNRLSHLLTLRHQLLPQRRHAQRCKRHVKRQETQHQLDTAWLQGDGGIYADVQKSVHVGALHYRNHRHHLPLSTLQHRLWMQEVGLNAKYNRQPAPPTNNSDDDDSESDGPEGPTDDNRQVQYTHPPTIQEITVALQSLHAQASALGLPTKVLRWLTTPLLLETLRHTFSIIWITGDIPSSFTLVRAAMLYKAGPHNSISSYRVIGVGSAMSRLFQLIITNRLMHQLQHRLSQYQFGFLAKRSTDECLFLATSTTLCAQLRDQHVHTAYLDIAGAFPSLPHHILHRELHRAGVDGTTRSLLRTWYSHQRIFTQLGRLTSNVIPCTIGVTEGCAFSPLCFIVGIDPCISHLQSMSMRTDHTLGLHLIRDTLTTLWFADDGWLASTTAEGLQQLLNYIGHALPQRGLHLNCAPTKSACMTHPPLASRTARAASQQCPPPTLTLSGQPLPRVAHYKHLGIDQSACGRATSRRIQWTRYAQKVATITRQALSSSLQHISLLHGVRLYTTRWLPQLTYAMGLYSPTVPPQLTHLESLVLKALAQAPNHPDVVLRSIVGLPTLTTRLDLARFLLFIRLLRAPPSSPTRQQLAIEVATYVRLAGSPSRNQLWWHSVHHLLLAMDDICDPGSWHHSACADSPIRSWVTWAMWASLHYDDHVLTLDQWTQHGRKTLLHLEARRRGWELDRCYASLDEVRDLLDTPNMAPFLACPRDAATALRVCLRGGHRTLFHFDHFHLQQCPWCLQADQFTVPHLLRDCPSLEPVRQMYWRQAHAVAMAAGVMAAGDPAQQRLLWYWLMCGAAVPHTFLHLHLDNPTHFARPPSQPATRQLRHHLQLYRHLLFLTGRFLCFAVRATTLRLEHVSHMLPRHPPQTRPRTLINHHHREQCQRTPTTTVANSETPT